MRSDLSSPLSVPEDSSSLSRVSPPSISFLVVLFVVFPPHTPASSPFPCRPHASHGQNTSFSVSPLFASVSSLLLGIIILVPLRTIRPTVVISSFTALRLVQHGFQLPDLTAC